MSKKFDSKDGKEMVGGCCVCSDERGWSENPLVYCDGAGCTVAVHQACYGIVKVPTGPWFCKKCESQERVARVKCELCPQRAGALKRTDSGGWCHVVCALYIPEAWFANVQTMEPIVLISVPQERFNKICYICEEQKRDTKAATGACMQCNRNGCKQYFHVTCAQAQGLLCEVTGSYANVKYCGYCTHHYKRLKCQSNVKTIPAFRPIHSENSTPESSPEKNPSNLKNHDPKIVPHPAIKEVKSPQVDQSVSSTSDAIPSSLPPNPNSEGSSKPGQVSRSYSEVSDISSVMSPNASSALSSNPSSVVSPNASSVVSPNPNDGEDVKTCSSDHNQEPSSSISLSDLSSQQKPAKDSSVPCEKMAEIDVGDNSHDTESNKVEIKEPSPSISKKGMSSKRSMRSSITSTTKSNPTKDNKKSVGKRKRDLRSSNIKSESSPGGHSSNLTGSHEFSGSIFGGSPYFQSLSAPGHVSLPSFSTQDNSAILNSIPLVPPPKIFPSQLSGSSRQAQDHSQDFPLTMEQLLEKQWEQGAQFLMEHGQHHCDISSLLTCLHRLKGENQQLDEQVQEMTSRRDQLIAVNARLSLPFSLYDARSTKSKSSSVDSLEDISSPDDIQGPRVDPPSVPKVQIPQNTNMIVEDILSPAETMASSLSTSKT